MEKQKTQQTLKVAEQLKKNGGCIAEVDLGVQPPFSYTEEELRVMEAIRSMYPTASETVVCGVFESLKKGYKPQTAPELIEWMDKLIVAYTLGEALGLSGGSDENN